MSRILLTILLLALSAAAQSDDLPYNTFYLGLNPKMKYAILEDMLSEKGKIFWINEDSVLVKDSRETLDKIGEFLSKRDIALKDQVKITLRRRNQGEEKSLDSDVGIKYDSRRGGSVTWKGGVEERSMLETGESSVTVVSGQAAEIRLQRSAAVIAALRDRFLGLAVSRVTGEGVVLSIRPVIAGSLVHLSLDTMYVARVAGKSRSFSTGELRTSVVLRPGAWLDVGGSSRDFSERNRRNVILGVENDDAKNSLDFAVKAEIIRLQEPDEVQAPQRRQR